MVAAFVNFDTGQWFDFQTSNELQVSLANLQGNDGVTSWLRGFWDGGAGQYVYNDVEALAYNYDTGEFFRYRTENEYFERIGEIVNDGRGIAFTVGDPNDTSGRLEFSDVVGAYINHGSGEWFDHRPATNGFGNVTDLQSVAGMASWRRGYWDAAAGNFFYNNVEAFAYNYGAGPWIDFATTNDPRQHVGNLVNDGQNIAWTTGSPGTIAGGSANSNVIVATLDRPTGLWQVFRSDYDELGSVTNLSTDHGVTTWTHGNWVGVGGLGDWQLAAVRFDAGQFQLFERSYDLEQVLVKLENLGGVFVWAIGDTQGMTLNAAIHDATPVQWQTTETFFPTGQIVQGFWVEDGTVYSIVNDSQYHATQTHRVPLDSALLFNETNYFWGYDWANATWYDGATGPLAAFYYEPATGPIPLSVWFSDRSIGTYPTWAWTFGDGATSALQSPYHTYTAAGLYFVTQTVVGPGGTAATVSPVLALVAGVGQSPVQMTLNGTAGDNTFEVVAGAAYTVIVNGVPFTLDPAVKNLAIDGMGGNDTVKLTGTGSEETATLRPGTAQLLGPGYRIDVAGAASIIVDGGGGWDVAGMFDSPGNDVFRGTPGGGQLSGPGFFNRVEDFQSVHAYAKAGGYDVAHLYDSPGDDTLTANPVFARLTGKGYLSRAKFFEATHAYSKAGGYDVAHLYDSAGDDTFVGRPTVSKLSGNGYLNRAILFDAVHAYGRAGGNDIARLYDSAGDDTFVGRPTVSKLSGSGYLNRVKFFEKVHVDAVAGGFDRAYLYDSPFDDFIEANANRVTLSSNNTQLDFLYEAVGFEAVKAKSTQGNDTKNIGPGVTFLQLLGGW